jgi:DNA helicase-2/ATP-dependent DNA helicase PcrA
MNLNELLNAEQIKAVKHILGPLLVLAGAGSGKTRCVTYRILYLLEQGIPAQQILGLTFTNKAAKEMKERIETLSHQHVLICTYHSLCARILRESIHLLGYQNNFVIYDEDDAEKIIKTCLKDLNIEYLKLEPKAIKSAISKLKSNETSNPPTNTPLGRHFPNIYSCYQTKLKEYNALDFDDLLFLTVSLFKEHPNALAHYQNQWQYLLIDEYQDTNYKQYELISQLAEKHRNIFAVGDPDQSIYSWRGADISNILHFNEDFPGAQIIRLEQNYRSTTNILNAANELILNNKHRYEKNLWSALGAGEKIKKFVGQTERDEARFVAEKVRDLHHNEQIPLNQMAVLYRTNSQSRLFEDQLINRRIPYTIIGGISFYQRKEIKDIVAYLRLVVSPSDYVSFLRTINLPKRGIGPTTIDKLRTNASALQLTIFDYCCALVDRASNTDMKLSKKQFESLSNYVSIIKSLQELLPSISIATLISSLVEKIGYYNHLKEEDEETYGDRKENIDQLIVKASEWDLDNNELGLTGFLEEIALKSTLDELSPEQERLSLMTLHNGKGLEFNTVFIVGLEQDLLPHANSRDSEEAIEEERRLFYVGMTRAKEKLFLCNVQTRSLWGQQRRQYPSRFLKEIPSEYTEPLRIFQRDAEYNYERQVKRAMEEDDFIDDIDQSCAEEEHNLFKPGESVFHQQFGIGVVKKFYQGSLGLTYDIQFYNDNNPKSLVAKYAKLSRI